LPAKRSDKHRDSGDLYDWKCPQVRTAGKKARNNLDPPHPELRGAHFAFNFSSPKNRDVSVTLLGVFQDCFPFRSER
jgi:hypothetical protein